MPTRKIVIAREKKHSTPSSSPPLLIIGRVTEMEHGKNSWSLASSFISSVHNVPFTSYGGPFINSTPSVDPVPSPARIMHKRRQENGATKNPITRTCLCVYIFFFFRTRCSIDDTPMQIYARSRCFVPTGRPSAFMATAWWRTCVYSCVYALAWCRLSDIAVVHNIMLISSLSFLLFVCILFFLSVRLKWCAWELFNIDC